MKSLTYDNFLIDKLLKDNNEIIKEGLIMSVSYTIFTEKMSDLLNKHNLKFSITKNPDAVKLELQVKKDKKLYDEIYSLLNLTGYYISLWYDDNNDKHISGIDVSSYMNNKNLIIYFNKKYDFEDNGIKIYMYHVTEWNHKGSILQKGIVLKSKKQIDNHPERIYLFDSLDDAKSFSVNFIKPIIFRIDMRLVNKIKLYTDPKFPNIDSFYTYDNIPKISLTEVEN